MGDPVRFGLVGCGAAGKLHALALRSCPSTELTLVADADPRPARALGQRHQVPWTAEMARVWEDPRIEAVSIAVPHHLHLDIATRAARAGKHVLLEKPFTMNCRQAAELVEVCRAAKVVVAPWLERRFLPYAGQARAIVAEGSLGKIVYTRISTLGYKPRAYWTHGMRFEEYPSAWRESVKTAGGGVLLMNSIHQIDLMLALSGLEVAEVTAHAPTLHHEVEVEDLAVALLRYTSGALGVVEASCCTYGMNEFPIERPADSILGTDGYLQLGSTLRSFDRIRFSQTYEFPKLSVTDLKVRQLGNFAAHLREGVSLEARPEDAMRAVAVIEAAYRSSREGAPVRL